MKWYACVLIPKGWSVETHSTEVLDSEQFCNLRALCLCAFDDGDATLYKEEAEKVARNLNSIYSSDSTYVVVEHEEE